MGPLFSGANWYFQGGYTSTNWLSNQAVVFFAGRESIPPYATIAGGSLVENQEHDGLVGHLPSNLGIPAWLLCFFFVCCLLFVVCCLLFVVVVVVVAGGGGGGGGA